MKKTTDKENTFDTAQFQKRIADLEDRVAGLESALKGISILKPGKITEPTSSSGLPGQDASMEKNAALESRIGQHGMAWMGNIVLLFGILFLTQFLSASGHQPISVVFGFAAVAVVYFLGYYTRGSLPYLSQLFYYNGHLLFFIQVLRISLIDGIRIIQQPLPAYALVLLVLSGLLVLAYRNSSQLLEVIVFVMAAVAAAASGSTYFLLSILVAVAGTANILTVRRGWWTGQVVSIILVYLTYMIWLFGNPFTGSGFGIIETHEYGHFFLFAIAILYSLPALLRESEKIPAQFLQASILLNGIIFSIAFLLTVLAFFTEGYSLYFELITAFCLGYAIYLKIRGDWNHIASMYAIYSFVALSIAVAGIYHFPKSFLLLAAESLLVVSMALWFRSRFITVMNTFLFAGLLITYLAVQGSSDAANFTFAIVALVTARITNWKKKRLDIRTELMRNFFLISGALMLLYSLQQAVPPHLVTLSWVLAAAAFFVLSVIIHNMKYRWLSISTMVVAAGYLFIVDLHNIGLGYRIVALMFIAAISLGISIYYSRKQSGHNKENSG